MKSNTTMASSSRLFSQWWQQCGTLVLELSAEYRQLWLEIVSQVIRYYRLARCSPNPTDQKLYASLCRVSLAESRAELMKFLVSGHIPLAQMQHLCQLKTDLEQSLEKGEYE